MTYKVNEDFLWFKAGQELSDEDVSVYKPEHVKKWVEAKHVSVVDVEEEVNLDLNGDGVVDEKDVSIAAKLMGKARQKGKSLKKRK